jgi:adenylate cyclase
MKSFLPAILMLLGLNLCAQDSELDSLLNVLGKSSEDTNKVNLLIDIAKKYTLTSPESATIFANRAKELSTKLGYPRGVAKALKWSGIVYFKKSDYAEAISHWLQSSAIFDSIKDKEGVANIQSNIGAIYFNQGEDGKANEYYFNALKAAEEINDTVRIATVLNNIAAVYQRKNKTQNKAIQFYQNSLLLSPDIKDEVKRRGLMGATYAGLGEVYMKKSEDDSSGAKAFLDTALNYTQLAIKQYHEMIDEPYALNQLGKIYVMQKDFDNAIRVQKQAVDIARKFESTDDIGISLVGLAQSLEHKGETRVALNTYQEAEKTAKETGAIYSLKDIYEGIARSYSKLHDYLNAYNYQLLLLGTKDSIYNIEADKKLQGIQFTFDLEKKEGQINLLTKDKQIQQQEIRRQKIVRNSFVGGFAVVLLFAGIFFNQRNRISKEKKRSDELLLNILPSETAEELKATGTAKAKSFETVTVMFTDFKNFTQASELLTPEELVHEINYCYSEFDKIVTHFGIEKIKTIGDSYMCAGGLPVPSSTHAEDVVAAGLQMQQFILKNKAERIAQNKPYFDLRLGIHSGPVVAGIVGIKKFAYDIWGDTVNTASRMESSGEIGKVNISGATYELVKDKFRCSHRGKIEAKNKGLIDMYFVEGDTAIETVEHVNAGLGVIHA